MEIKKYFLTYLRLNKSYLTTFIDDIPPKVELSIKKFSFWNWLNVQEGLLGVELRDGVTVVDDWLLNDKTCRSKVVTFG